MMKNPLAVSTLAFQDWELEDAVRICRENEIDAMEIRLGFHDWSKMELSDQVYRENYRKISDGGLQVSDLGTSIRVIGYDEKRLEELKQCAHIAELLHCRGLRIMLGNRHRFWSDKVPEIDYDGLVRWMIEADEILENSQAQIWIETHDEFATGKMQRKLLNEYPFRNVRLLWDIMHPLEAGEEPEETLGYMGKDLVHVHIKDGQPWPDPDRSSWKYTRLGEGDVPIRKIVRKIRQAGYTGYFSLEWESAWREEIRGKGYAIEDMVRQYSYLMKEIMGSGEALL